MLCMCYKYIHVKDDAFSGKGNLMLHVIVELDNDNNFFKTFLRTFSTLVNILRE